MTKLEDSLENFYSGKEVLVTGGASFIGSHLSELLVKAGARVTIADDLSSGRREFIKQIDDEINFIHGDLRNEEIAKAATYGKEIVFHLAASHGGRGYIETHPVECVNNIALDHTVFSSAAKNGVKKVIFASSACVYPTDLQASEESRLLLNELDANFTEPGKAFADGEYGWAKLMGELQLRAFYHQFGMSGIACRIFTAYGERENESHAVIALIAKAHLRLDPFPIWGHGMQTRNFTYVKDTVMGMALAGVHLSGFDVINIGTDQHYTIIDLIDEVFKCMSWRPDVIERQLDKPVGVKSRAADIMKCEQVLRWRPSYSLSEGVKATVKWYQLVNTKERTSDFDRLLMERA